MLEILDICGALFSFISTCFYITVNPLAWPIGLIAICIGIFLFFEKGIYGDMSLKFLYFAMTLYGWYQWKFGGKKHKALPISNLSFSLASQLLCCGLVATTIVHFILLHYTNSHVPWMDAFTTVFSLIAEWMICKKIIQCWFVWFVVDGLYVGMYFYKGIPAHGTLCMIYTGMAIAGYVNWTIKYRRQAQVGV